MRPSGGDPEVEAGEVAQAERADRPRARSARSRAATSRGMLAGQRYWTLPGSTFFSR